MTLLKQMIDKTNKEFSLIHFIITIAILSIVQSALITLGLMPVLTDYFSFGSILFNIIKLGIAIYAGYHFSKDGLKKSTAYGAMLGFTSTTVIIIFSFISKTCCQKPILGISITPSAYWLALLFIILENMILWAIITFASALITQKIRKR